MKKTMIVFAMIVTIMIATISYIYLRYVNNLEITKQENVSFESYYNQEIFGTDLATLINKAMDSNEKNNVKKDNNNIYIDNEENSIKIDIKFTDDGKVHQMEELFNKGISSFVGIYNQIKFKCTNVEHHSKTNKIKYMLFEQITD